MKKKPIIIAGPCAAESMPQIMASLAQAKKRKVDFMRVSLWKPRTKPGFDGLGEKGIDLLIQAAKLGVNPATEILIPEQAEIVMKKVLSVVSDIKLLLWIGSRNQNHYIQREIARIVAKDKRVFLMVKNQPWTSEDHWEGIIAHVLEGGIPKERLLLCHRGFTPQALNPHGYRNVPDFVMTKQIQKKTGLPMLFDPSHTGGSVEKVLQITKDAKKQDLDGLIVEVHPDPKVALMDAKQQLTWEQFDQLIQEFYSL